MAALGTSYELVKHKLKSNVVDYYDLFFTGVGGASVHCQLIQPKQQRGPILLQFHVYHGDSGNWADKLAWAAEGFTVFCLDMRGQGGLSEDVTKTKGGTLKGHIMRGVEEGPENRLYRSVFLDVYQLTQIAMTFPGVDPEQLYVKGNSQGGSFVFSAGCIETSH